MIKEAYEAGFQAVLEKIGTPTAIGRTRLSVYNKTRHVPKRVLQFPPTVSGAKIEPGQTFGSVKPPPRPETSLNVKW